MVHDGLVPFLNTSSNLDHGFNSQYVTTLISKYLLASSNYTTGYLEKSMQDVHIDLHIKYLILIDIPINLLLWVC